MNSEVRPLAEAIAELQTVMRLIDVLLEEVSAAAPPGQRALIPNALLNLAVERILAEQAAGPAATILYRLADLIAEGKRPARLGCLPAERTRRLKRLQGFGKVADAGSSSPTRPHRKLP